MTDKRLCREAGPVVSGYSDNTASVYLQVGCVLYTTKMHAHLYVYMQMCIFMFSWILRLILRCQCMNCEYINE